MLKLLREVNFPLGYYELVYVKTQSCKKNKKKKDIFQQTQTAQKTLLGTELNSMQ